MEQDRASPVLAHNHELAGPSPVSYQVIVNLIGATTTRAGLQVQADLDTDVYPTKVKVTDKQLATVDLHPHRFHGEWNYTISAKITSV